MLAKHQSQQVFIDIFGSNPMSKAIEFFVGNPDTDFTLIEVAEKADIGRTTLWAKVIDNLLNEGIIIKSRQVGMAKLYKLNLGSEQVQMLVKLYEKLKRLRNGRS
jgi:hypothetical protein